MNTIKVKISDTLFLTVDSTESKDSPPKSYYNFRLWSVNKHNVEYPTRTGFLLPKFAMDDFVNQLMVFMIDQSIPKSSENEKV